MPPQQGIVPHGLHQGVMSPAGPHDPAEFHADEAAGALGVRSIASPTCSPAGLPPGPPRPSRTSWCPTPCGSEVCLWTTRWATSRPRVAWPTCPSSPGPGKGWSWGHVANMITLKSFFPSSVGMMAWVKGGVEGLCGAAFVKPDVLAA